MPLTTDAEKAIARARKHSFGPMGDILKLLADAAEIANAATMSISADGQKAVARAKAESFGDDEDVRKLLAAIAEGLAAGGGGGGGGTGTVTVVSVVPNAGVSATVANPNTTPALTFTLGAITPASVVSPGTVAGNTVMATGGTGFQGAGGLITGLNGSAISIGTVASARIAAALTGKTVNGVNLVTAGSAALYLSASGTYTAPAASVTAIRSYAGTADTFVAADAGAWVRSTGADAANQTVPTNAFVAFPVGTILTLRQGGAGAVTLSGSGVTLNGDLTTAGPNKTIQLVKVATDTWDVTGGVTV